ncbi:tyrosine-type recombinase/integrase [Pontixanthobacter aquaemixtae]|uniref:tyrosine-type recombinase/integrase n=1 Tax=Pontixanthobacter aquaemixtae TaxID=1958940 RepID=UPI002E25B05F|nr:tyrosine-type recombinase/integrase [Pontixanthobacter aquaemixtae]
MADLSNVTTRNGLKPRISGKQSKTNDPYWQKLFAGCFIGYRASEKVSGKSANGTWFARVTDPDTGKYKKKKLGDYGELEPSRRFKAAKDAAEEYAKLVETGGELTPEIQTVADACRDYTAKLATPEKRKETKQRFDRYIYDQPLARVKLEKLRKRHLQEWRDWLEKQPALVSRSKRGEVKVRPRAPSTINRDMAVLRAALSKVLAYGAPGTVSAWQEPLASIRRADGKRKTYLDREQRRQLLRHMSREAEPFVRALCLLPIRPGAMANLSVGDYQAATGLLNIGKDKAGETRDIPVPDEAAKLLSEQSKDKLPAAPIFMRKDGSRWTRHTWKRPISVAVEAAGLPGDATAYTLRHSTITDLVKAGLPLLTIAQISGTSAEMIERHYGQLTNEAALNALEGLAL